MSSNDTSLSHAMYDRIQSEILNSELPPDARLSAEGMARRFDVSPTPIREALARLASDGLVLKAHLRGYRVAPRYTAADFRALFEVRQLLEPHTAQQAAARAQPTDDRQLETANEALRHACHNDSQVREVAAADAEFHTLIAAMAGNKIVIDTLEHLHTHLHLFRLRQDRNLTAEQAVLEHVRIIEAIQLRDPVLAEAAMRSHIARALSRVEGALRT